MAETFVSMDNLPCASGPDAADPILVACEDCMYPVSAQGEGYSVNLPPWPVQVHEAGPRFNWIPRYSCRVGGCIGDLPWNDLNSGGACYNEALTYGNPCYCDAACTRFKDCCYDFIWSCKISVGIQDINEYTGEELYGTKELGDMLF
jgi:hypothetical protein